MNWNITPEYIEYLEQERDHSLPEFELYDFDLEKEIVSSVLETGCLIGSRIGDYSAPKAKVWEYPRKLTLSEERLEALRQSGLRAEEKRRKERQAKRAAAKAKRDKARSEKAAARKADAEKDRRLREAEAEKRRAAERQARQDRQDARVWNLRNHYRQCADECRGILPGDRFDVVSGLDAGKHSGLLCVDVYNLSSGRSPRVGGAQVYIGGWKNGRELRIPVELCERSVLSR